MAYKATLNTGTGKTMATTLGPTPKVIYEGVISSLLEVEFGSGDVTGVFL